MPLYEYLLINVCVNEHVSVCEWRPILCIMPFCLLLSARLARVYGYFVRFLKAVMPAYFDAVSPPLPRSPLICTANFDSLDPKASYLASSSQWLVLRMRESKLAVHSIGMPDCPYLFVVQKKKTPNNCDVDGKR